MAALIQRFLSIGAIVATLTHVPMPACAQAEEAPGPLVVVATKGVEKVGAAAGRVDCGLIDSLATPRLEHTFTVRNEALAPVIIDRMQASCGCTSILVGGKEGAKQSIAPGEQVAIRLTTDVTKLHPGPLDKFVWIYTSRGGPPTLTLELVGSIRAPVVFSPAVIDFGRGKARSKRQATFTASIDRRLVASGEWPLLISSNPDVRIVPLQSPAGAPAKDAALVSREYTATLSTDARLGPVIGTASFVPTLVPRTPGQAPPPGAAGIGTVTITLTGDVEGNILAMPSAITFGAVKAGQPAARRIKVLATHPRYLLGLTVTCSNKWITAPPPAPISPASPSDTGAAVTIDFTLSPDAPEGGHEGQVVIATTDGERLVLPIIVYVTK